MPTEYLILDYERPAEAERLLHSIKRHSHFDYKVTYLSNGGHQDYVKSFKKQGLIDNLILNPQNVGCGAGTIQLFAHCRSKHAFYVQVDHVLIEDITNETIISFTDILEDERFGCVDMAGNQGNPRGAYSERAQFINVNFYNSIPKCIGGPGPWNHIRWTEKYVQTYFTENHLQIASISPLFFKDAGLWSIRSNPDGSKWKQRSDTKQLWLLKAPSEKFSWPLFSDEEWTDLLITKAWPDGKVPGLVNNPRDSFSVPDSYWAV